MKKRIIAICACALAFCAPAADSKIATRDWVIKQLATSGIRVSQALTTHNTNGTFTVTVPFTSDTLTNCVSLSLTFTDPSIVTRLQPQVQPALRRTMLKSGTGYSDIYDNQLVITLMEGFWTDNTGKKFWFFFSEGFDFTWPEELPEVPSEDHVCELDADCYCIWYNRVPKYPDDYPEEYRLKTTDDFDNSYFGNILSWIDMAAWPDQTFAAGKTRYWITDEFGNRLNLEQIGKIDLWRNVVEEARETLNTRLRECCEAFIKSCECKASNPQHDWKTTTCGSHSWSVCRNNDAHKQGSEAHQYPGSVKTDAGHSCVCGDKTQAHTYGPATVVSQVGWIVTYRETCTVCSYAHEWQDDINPCKNGHVPLTDVCGCACGYFSPTNNIAADERFHHFTAGGANGNPACLCDCGHKHRFKNISQYEANRFPTYTNCTQCLGVCWECRERDVNGNIVPASSHTAFTTSEARGAARCGCRCGKVTASENGDSRFHYRNSTGVGGLPSCRCYGVNAKASGASPGNYHYYSPSACPKVCSVEWNGQRHLTTTSVFPENTAWTAIAKVTDHEAKDTGTTCGCKCGYYNNVNWRDWNGKADFHRPYNSCCCGCPAQHHLPITRDGCTELCGGNCTGLYSDKTWRQSAGALFEEKYHFPSETACACKCNYFHGSSAPKKFHAVTNAVNSCFCECKTYHKFYHARNDCLKICSTHGDYDHLAGVDPAQWAQASDHSFEPNSCFCKCPAHVLHPEGHRFAPDVCDSCYCGMTSRSHKMKTSGAETTSTYTCDSCNNTITVHIQPLECERCGFTDSSSWESGHDPGCGSNPVLLVECEIHKNFEFEGPTEEAHDGFGPRFWGIDNAVLGKWTKTSNWTYISLNHELSENLDEWFDILYFPVFVAGDVVCPKCMEAVRKKEETSGGGTSGTGGGGGSGGLGGLTDI